MLKQWMCVALMALACVVSAGCKSGGESAGKSDVLAVVPVPILSHVAGNGTEKAFKDPGVYLVNDADALAAYEVEELSKLEVDFASQSVIILTPGQCPTLGYAAKITGVQKLGDIIYVQGTVSVPAPGSNEVGQAITYPYAAAVVSKVTGSLIPDITQSSAD